MTRTKVQLQFPMLLEDVARVVNEPMWRLRYLIRRKKWRPETFGRTFSVDREHFDMLRSVLPTVRRNKRSKVKAQ